MNTFGFWTTTTNLLKCRLEILVWFGRRDTIHGLDNIIREFVR